MSQFVHTSSARCLQNSSGHAVACLVRKPRPSRPRSTAVPDAGGLDLLKSEARRLQVRGASGVGLLGISEARRLQVHDAGSFDLLGCEAYRLQVRDAGGLDLLKSEARRRQVRDAAGVNLLGISEARRLRVRPSMLAAWTT